MLINQHNGHLKTVFKVTRKITITSAQYPCGYQLAKDLRCDFLYLTSFVGSPDAQDLSSYVGVSCYKEQFGNPETWIFNPKVNDNSNLLFCSRATVESTFPYNDDCNPLFIYFDGVQSTNVPPFIRFTLVGYNIV